MIAAGAVARVIGPDGQRDVAVEDIATGPGKTSLASGEIVASIFLPKRPANSGDAYLRFIPRTEMDIAVVGVGGRGWGNLQGCSGENIVALCNAQGCDWHP